MNEHLHTSAKMSDRYDPVSRGFDDIAYRRLTPRAPKTSLPEPTSHERDTLRRRVEDMAAKIRQLKNVINLKDLGEGLLGASSKTLEGNLDEADRHKARSELFLKSSTYTQLTMKVVMRDAVDGMYTAFAPPGTRDVAKAEESLLLDMQSHEVEAYINRRLRAQPYLTRNIFYIDADYYTRSMEPTGTMTGTTTGDGSGNVSVQTAESTGSGGNRFGM